MNKEKLKQEVKERRRRRVRAKVSGTSETPRLTVYRSLKYIYAQVIDDSTGKTLVAIKDTDIKEGKNKTEKAFAAGKILGEKALEKKISRVVFDKGSFKFHGRVKALADGVKEAGLKI